ncbi:HlyD family secretion protein [Methylocystis parvus]|uniref:HlyD family secretion protein n=1 Tax=Methylocystis parvus TaxID=134 RepID=A0A6B8M6N6_9HYPH|nr:HlyD family secretion protein [Methylocystis parvus]QGM98138.1 HlyD family secretion protein [Methylocystis parvus]WBK01539.1 HlyD family secretion protein [Methylocystis parvus OBBP]
MKAAIAKLIGFLFTTALTAAAIFVGWRLWAYYEEEPWTRDGRVRAEVVAVAPDVSGLVSEVLVHDNQRVRKGDILFRIDRKRFELALRQAEATVANRIAALEVASQDFKRYRTLDAKNNIAVSKQQLENVTGQQAQAQAVYEQALAERDLARLNLERSEVRASVNGPMTNFELRPGSYVTAGKAIAALVDEDSLHVDGYFEETKLPMIRVGDRAAVHLMGERRALFGHVEGIAAGIEDRDRSSGVNLLANVNPTFNWVRLAQRVPVRIALDRPPPDVPLVAGRTATVVIGPDKEGNATFSFFSRAGSARQ